MSIYTAPANIPVGTNVTITATVTGSPSASKNVTLPVILPGIVVSFYSMTPVTSLVVNKTTTFSAQAQNDIQGKGISWTVTCSSADCGTFSSSTTASQSSTTYKAPATVPAGGTVTVTATSVSDPTKSASAVVTILPVAINLDTTSLQVGVSSTASLVATVTNDSSSSGVDWKLSCGGASSIACGTITSHTASGAVAIYKGPPTVPPVNPVTITASSSAVPSVVVTANAMVVPTSGISVAVSSPSSSVSLNGTATFTAQVSNDASLQGVTWTVKCSSGSGCGSVVSSGTNSGSTIYTAIYTAPASVPPGAQVVVVATPVSTDPGNSGMASIKITQTPPTVTIQQQPPSSLSANGKAPVSAVVANDPSSGGVTWSVKCNSTVGGGCGYVSPYRTASGATATYIAPPISPSGQVSIVATSASNSSVSVTSTPVTVVADTALSVNFVPVPPTQLQVDTSVNLNAYVTNDITNAGIDWQVCSSGCGFFTITPAIPAIPATAKTPYVPEVPAVTATSVKGWPNSLPISYTAPSTPPPGGAVAIVATAHVDGKTGTAASVTISSSNNGPTLTGVVQSGLEPLVGAAVSLYTAGNSGYGSASSLIYASNQPSYATTDSSGRFMIPGGYSCPQPGSQMYLLAIGGHVGSSAPNPNLVFMTALGSCNALSSSPVVVNEITSVAVSWAVAHFVPEPIDTGTTTYLNIGSSRNNTTGLANAFAAAQSLVDISTGRARSTVPAGNAAVPYAEINTLADALNACAVTAGGTAGDGSACGTLFAAATSNAATVGNFHAVPGDTLQAVMQVAQHPFRGLGYQTDVASIYSLVSADSPFQPILTTAPHDFSLALNFVSGGGLTSNSTTNYLALDAAGNLWMTDSAGNKVIEWNNLGAPITSSSGFTTNSMNSPGALAVDSSGNVWVCGSGTLTELTSLGTEALGSPFYGGGLSGTCQGMAIDASGSIWALNSNSVTKFDSLGEPLSPATGFTIPVSPTDSTTVSLLPPISIDSSNNVWVGVVNPKISAIGQFLSLAELNNASGAPYNLSPAINDNATPSNFVNISEALDQTQIATDGSGNVWVPDSGVTGNLIKIPSYSGSGIDTPTQFYSYSASSFTPLGNARGVALDGAGRIWVGSQADSSQNKLPNLSEFNPASGAVYGAYLSSSFTSRPLSVSVDNAGNVWVLLSNNTITEFVGIATPAVTPLATAVKNAKLGARP